MIATKKKTRLDIHNSASVGFQNNNVMNNADCSTPYSFPQLIRPQSTILYAVLMLAACHWLYLSFCICLKCRHAKFVFHKQYCVSLNRNILLSYTPWTIFGNVSHILQILLLKSRRIVSATKAKLFVPMHLSLFF